MQALRRLGKSKPTAEAEENSLWDGADGDVRSGVRPGGSLPRFLHKCSFCRYLKWFVLLHFCKC